MEYQYPLVATHRDGHTQLFYDAETFCKFAYDRANGGVGGYWMEGRSFYGSVRLHRIHSLEGRSYRSDSATNTWIVRDNRGQVVDKEQVGTPTRYYPYWYWGRGEERRRAAEQGLPIPGCGKRRWHRKSSTINGRNGAHNQRKGIKLYEDPKIKNGDFGDL